MVLAREREAGAGLKSLVLWVPEGDERDALIARLYEEDGTTGITEMSNSIRAFFDGDVHSLLEKYAAYEPDVFEEEERDWVAESQAQWPPLPVGERWYLVPEWRDDPAPCGRIRLRTFPGMACGSGAHPATQLCLIAMESWVQPEEDSVLDVGTGSGILAQAAHLLGAERVFGCDIEHDSTVIAKRNFEEFVYRVPLFTGSLRSVRTKSLSLTVANLNAETLKNLAAELLRVTKRVVIVSGFRTDELSRLESALGKAAQTWEQEGWTAAAIEIAGN